MAPKRVRNRQPIPEEDVPPEHPWVCMQPHCRKFRWGYHSAGLLRDLNAGYLLKQAINHAQCLPLPITSL